MKSVFPLEKIHWTQDTVKLAYDTVNNVHGLLLEGACLATFDPVAFLWAETVVQ